MFDHTRAEGHALRELMAVKSEVFNGIDEARFLMVYHRHNTILWRQLARGEVTAEELKVRRFAMTCSELNIDQEHCDGLAQYYMEVYPQKRFFIAGALELLEYCRPRFELGILSNGFTLEQHTKLDNLGIKSFFKYLIFSEDVGVHKPDRLIFEAALKEAGAGPEEVVFIGDSYESDIVGGNRAGWRTIFFNPDREQVPDNLADAEITTLHELSMGLL